MFHETSQWTRIENGEFEQVFTYLWDRYRSPVLTHVRTRYANGSGDAAEELVQGFYTFLWEKGRLDVDRGRGRFRGWLCTCLKHYVVNEFRAQSAQKRGGNTQTVSLDMPVGSGNGDSGRAVAEHVADAHTLGQDDAFDRTWAQHLLTEAENELEHYYETVRSEGDFFRAVRPYLQQRGESYAEVAANFGISEANVRQKVLRIRRRYVETLRGLVRDTVSDDGMIDDELARLYEVLYRN